MNDTTFTDVLACVADRWSPVIGDPSVMGWVTVAAYGAASLMSFGAALVRIRDRRFWLLIGILLALLCVNKQLDLQSALTATGRCLSRLQGWYEDRRKVQLIFIIGLALIGVLTFLMVAVRQGPALHRTGIALLGFGLLVVFVAVRAAGMHHVDELINTRIGGAKMNWILELSGIVLILLNAITAILGRRSRRKQGGTSKPGRRGSNLPYSRSN